MSLLTENEILKENVVLKESFLIHRSPSIFDVRKRDWYQSNHNILENNNYFLKFDNRISREYIEN